MMKIDNNSKTHIIGQITRLKVLFASYSAAHGRCKPGKAPPGEKVKAKSYTVHSLVTDQTWQEHLTGHDEGLGLIPLLDDGISVKWAAIDIDDNSIDHARLDEFVQELNLPLVICRSKSGGAHCYIFLEQPALAEKVVPTLENWAAALGYPGVEIFPKQTKRMPVKAGKPDPGNWINLPYFGGENTLRYCICDGEAVSLERFLDFAEANRVGEDALKIRHFAGKGLLPHHQTGKSGEGRNGFLYSAGCGLRAQGMGDEEIRTKLVELNTAADPDCHPNFANGPLQDRELEEILRQVLKHQPGSTDPEITVRVEELNSRHAVVMLGGKCVVLNEDRHPTLKFKDVSFSPFSDFQSRYQNQHFFLGKRKVSIGKLWLDSPQRRQFNGVTFAPGEETPGFFNLDTGFAVEPKRGNWSLYLDHIRNIVCGADDDVSDYVIAWMADTVQNRSRRPGTAIVLRGKQGTGKGMFCNQFGSLFGQHYIHVAHSKHLTGHFNSHLKDKLVVHADEAFWAGDKKAEGVLKAMVTEHTIQIEMKGKDVLTFPNYIRLLVSSNHDWVVPAGNEERRFFIIDVSEARMQDRAYFGAIVEQMKNGGREALLQYLLDYDLNGIDLGLFPKTSALQEQKMHSAPPVQQWWFDRLMSGTTRSDISKWQNEERSSEIYTDYCEFSENVGIKRRSSETKFGMELRRLVPGLEKVRIQKNKYRYWAYLIPTLDECRRAFDNFTFGENEWPTDE